VKTNLAKPFVEFHGFKGNFLNTFTLPENLKCRSRKGPRNNGTLEGHLFEIQNDILILKNLYLKMVIKLQPAKEV
jgi:hypothetical protein